MKNFKFIVAAGIFAAFLFTLGGTAQAKTIIVRHCPPAVRVDVRPHAPFRGALWIPGRWHWKRDRFVWVRGYYVKPRPGYVWVPGRWAKRPVGWVWITGHWRRV